MTLKNELKSLDAEKLVASVDMLLESAGSHEEDAKKMHDATWSEYPALDALQQHLADTFVKVMPRDDVKNVMLGAGLVFLTLRQYIEGEEIRAQFPSAPQ